MNTDHESYGDPRPDFLPAPKPGAGFQAPEGYFAGMQEQILVRIQREDAASKSEAGRVVPIRSSGLFRQRMAYAATVLLLVVAGMWIFQHQGAGEMPSETGLSDAEIRAYIESHADEFDEEMVFKVSEPLEHLPLLGQKGLEDQSLDPLLLEQMEDVDDKTLEALFL